MWFDVPDVLALVFGLLTLNDSLLLPLHKDFIKWIMCNGMPKTLDPLVLLFLGRCRHAINSVLTLDNLKKDVPNRNNVNITLKNSKASQETHFALGIRLACFYNFSTTWSVQFKTVWLTFVGDFAFANLESCRKVHTLFIHLAAYLLNAKLTLMFSSGMMPRGSLSVVYSK